MNTNERLAVLTAVSKLAKAALDETRTQRVAAASAPVSALETKTGSAVTPVRAAAAGASGQHSTAVVVSAVRAARNSVFDINDAAPARHTGTITYIFIPQ